MEMNKGTEREKMCCAGEVGSWVGRRVEMLGRERVDMAHGAGLGEFFFFCYYVVFHFPFLFQVSNLQI
jgi:hypothetical protein